jgi:hypothetical protein
VLRKTNKNETPKTAARSFLRLPEPTADQGVLDAQVSPPPSPTKDVDDSTAPGGDAPPHTSSPSPVQRGDAPAADATSRKRPHPAGSLPPTAKRVKSVALDALFTQGFTAVKGVKPKASDYAPIPHALLIRACADYSARIVAVDAFPEVGVQMKWAQETFRAACRAAGNRYVLTDRMAKIVRVISSVHLAVDT